jgi:hypothetical protein
MVQGVSKEGGGGGAKEGMWGGGLGDCVDFLGSAYFLAVVRQHESASHLQPSVLGCAEEKSDSALQ